MQTVNVGTSVTCSTQITLTQVEQTMAYLSELLAAQKSWLQPGETACPTILGLEAILEVFNGAKLELAKGLREGVQLNVHIEIVRRL